MKRKTTAQHHSYTKENKQRINVEKHERKNVSINLQHLSPGHDRMLVKKKKSKRIASVSCLSFCQGLL